MRELQLDEIEAVSGGLDPDSGAIAIIGLGLLGGPFIAAAGLTIGLGILFRDALSN